MTSYVIGPVACPRICSAILFCLRPNCLAGLGCMVARVVVVLAHPVVMYPEAALFMVDQGNAEKRHGAFRPHS